MNKKIKITSLVFVLLLATTSIVLAWGSWGHKHISKAAIFSLPEQMRIFYYNHEDYLAESAVVPDLRRPLLHDRDEAPRHFIDLEDFHMPVAELPQTPKEVHEKYDWKFLNKTGILPWHIQLMMEELTQAFKERSKSNILFLSSELSHYVADAHMPLHTSSNYNGQFTGQTGVHSLWESVLPNLFGDTFNLRTAAPKYIENVTEYTWKMIEQSHALVAPLLADEMKVRNIIPEDKRYKKDAAGKPVLFYGHPVYSDAYAALFQKELGGMVESQLRLSIYDVSCYWYTAWVNGGKPDLTTLDNAGLTKQNRKNYRKEYKAWKKGKVLNLTKDKE